MRTLAHALHAACLGALVFGLTACGGGGGGGSSSNASSGNTNSTTNSPPTISGQPNSNASVGQAYSFQPTAQDPEGAALQFSVQNLPSWASFSASTGRISGTPAAAAVGSYSGITITVSDGSQTAQLGPFAITVVDVGSGAATLSWTPPTENTDGSSLNNLSGYRILYGQSSNSLSQTVDINNPSISTYVVNSLATGTWYFAVVAVNGQGTTSALSNVATKTIS